MARIPLFVFLVAILASFASATVPTFCKCTCFKNSTIIPLGPQHDNPPPAPVPPPSSSLAASASSSTSSPASETSISTPDDDDNNNSDNTPRSPNHHHHHNNNHSPRFHWLTSRETSTSCKQCNRAFCLKYNLPICKDAEENDIVTDCFHRDSAKDQIVVWGFILGTAGLLGWAGLRRVVEKHQERRRLRGVASAAAAGGGGGGAAAAAAGGLGLRASGGGGGGIVGDSYGGNDNAGTGANTSGWLWRRGSAGGVRGVYSPLGDDGAGAVR
ncbi:hypothetical protein MFIFM68171_06345 [Madurella fahalii]|uniref:Uncharacterized protein n=1 Tax=Madurella fahalii TaxID=1157608 RepID=A0ABQ0GEL8_9PEZI